MWLTSLVKTPRFVACRPGRGFIYALQGHATLSSDGQCSCLGPLSGCAIARQP